MVDIDVLAEFNSWWTAGKVPEALLAKHQRPLFKTLEKYLTRRQILLIFGLRRTGKTTILYQLIQSLLSKGVNPLHLCYFSFDEKRVSLEEIVKIYQEKVLKKSLSEVKKPHLFFDEIQKIDDWESRIKILYDLYPNLKIILSGSASISLQTGAKESLAGRMFEFFLPPLTFNEFLKWKKVEVKKDRLEVYQRKVIPLFLDYLRKGGFPEITDEEDDLVIRNYIKNAVLERVIFKDLPQEFGLKDTELLRLLIEMVVYDPGMIINFDRLSRDLGRSKVTIINYFEYLRYALITREIKNLRPGFLVTSRKGKKIYPTNSSFCFAYREDFYEEKVLQKIAEVAVVNFMEAKYYFRNSFEVDMVIKEKGQVIPIEVKYGGIEEKSIHKFLEEFKLRKGVIVSKDIYKKGKKLTIIPLWRFLLAKK